MTTAQTPRPCVRPGCDFPRRPDTRPNSKYTTRLECSPQCSVWMLRAKWADRKDDAKEAAELMRLVPLLDARRHAMEQVPGVFTKHKTYAS